MNLRDGARPVKSHRAGRVPGPVPQKGPPRATGGHPVPLRGARLRRRRVNATGQTPDPEDTTRPLNILQWNAKGVLHKKVPLTERLHAENIDVACLQETPEYKPQVLYQGLPNLKDGPGRSQRRSSNSRQKQHSSDGLQSGHQLGS